MFHRIVVLDELKRHSYDDQFGTSYATPTSAYAHNRRPAANIQTHRNDVVIRSSVIYFTAVYCSNLMLNTMFNVIN